MLPILHKRNLNDDKCEGEDDNKKARIEKDDDHQQQLTIVTHNCNSLYNRLINKTNDKVDYKQYNDFINEHNVDIICFQEVRAPARGNDRTRISTTYGKDKKSKMENEVLTNFLSNDFNKYFSLADQRYGGSLVAIKKGIKVHWIAYTFSKAFELDRNTEMKESFDLTLIKNDHHEDGRVIIVQLENITLIATYSPNNGSKPEQFQRREKFDAEISKFCRNWKKPICWAGDLNIAPDTEDTSHPQLFENENKNSNPELTGLAGCTKAERMRFKQLMSDASLIDAWKSLHPLNGSNEYDPEKNNFTWRGSDSGKFKQTAMRLDHVILSSSLESKLIDCKILGHGFHKEGFLGSDHCPLKVVLKI